ncbi:MAG: glycosyltransferase family 4 protein, partial [Gramella sp.]|nr:glycosyltransferase family 4 protein [Christiangramia sp.]
PGVNMNIYGAYPSQKVLNLHNPKEKFLVHGWVKNSTEAMRNSRVRLAPIQFGAGLKGKLVEAMECGTPSVTTEVGREGINNSEEWNGYISRNADELIEHSLKLYTDKKTWESKQITGFDIYNNRFDTKLHTERFQERLERLKSDLDEHRNLNFTGKILKHHLHKSTYYMSRFIEEKNRNKN